MAAPAAPAARLVVVSGCGGRGVGLGVARQVLAQDPAAQVVVTARALEFLDGRDPALTRFSG